MNLQRVAWIALIYFFARSIRVAISQLSNLWPLLVVFFTAGAELRGLILLGVAIVVPTFLLVFTVLSWWFFRYALSEHSLHVREGIIWRKQLTLDFARIQQADVREPWYFRPFKLAILGVESAGSDSKEVQIAGLSTPAAYRMKEKMLAETAVDTDVSEGLEAQQHTAQASTRHIFSLPVTEVARYGLIYNPVLLLLPILAYPLGQANVVDDYVMPYLNPLLDSLERFQADESLWLTIAIIALLSLAIVVGLSVLLAIIRFYGYQLTAQGSRYHAKMGLISVTSRSFQYVRLQRVVLQQGFIALWLRRFSLRINQSGQGRQQQQTDKVFFVPVLNAERQQQLATELQLETPTWQGFHWASTLLPWLMTTLFITLAVALISQFSWTAIGYALAISAIAGVPIQWQMWRKRAFFLGDYWLATRHGLFGQQQRFIPSVKIQQVTLQQGPWLRLWGSAKLHVYSAAGRETIAWLPYAQIKTLQQQLLQRSTDFKGRWM